MSITLQNVVFPITKDPDVLPLYTDSEAWTRIDSQHVRLSQNASIDNVISRSSVRVREGRRVSFASYFNAFPASYWQRWTVIDRVKLTLETTGRGTVIVYRSNAQGVQQRVDSVVVEGSATHEFDLPLRSFSDGGWYWFDIIAGTEDVVLERGNWSTEATPVETGKLSLGMTTYNKPDYCVSTLENVAGDAALLEGIDRIFLVDQGTQKVRDQAGFDEVAALLGDKLAYIEQGNIGGSGGFSRSMAETLEREDSDFLMLLDDDVEFETESALRALQFGRFNREPVIVGGHMFDLLDKPVMHAWAEVVNRDAFMWGPSFKEQHRHDFRRQNLRQTKWMHARLDADYNGWWMCMIPKKIIADIGLSLPVFIKWDDAEYGVRAQRAGYRTVSMPGVALWHVSWLDKDDSQDWQAFFHTRNRMVAALLHSDQAGGGKMLQNAGRQDIKKLLNMQYYAVQLSIDGMRAVLRGPAELHRGISSVMPEARARAVDFPETHVYKPGDSDVPVALGGRALPSLEEDPKGPVGKALAIFTARMLPLHWRRQSAETDNRAPELEYSKLDANWWIIPRHESVLVGAADGSGKMWYRHDRAKFRRLFKQSRELRREIAKNWETLSAQYRAALPEITSAETWKKTFDGK